MKIWAHRGCSLFQAENTLLAFEKAAELKGLTGIELDIQLTKDGSVSFSPCSPCASSGC